MHKFKLHGFNNLTKNLNFSIYQIFYLSTKNNSLYLNYINKNYNAKYFTILLKKICLIIGANILNIAYQDYEPQGTSVTCLVSEEFINKKQNIKPQSILSHLDKSHLCVHTYPETNPNGDLFTFRADIDISTCGLISPLKAINFLLNKLNADIIIIDYYIRGFTRDISGKKFFIDHKLKSIQDYLSKDLKNRYALKDFNLNKNCFFQTKMIRNSFNLNNYFLQKNNITNNYEKRKIIYLIQKERHEIFNKKNF